MIDKFFLDSVSRIPNRFSEPIGPLLYSLAICNRPKLIVETGTCWGYLTAWMAKAASEIGGQVVSIDYYAEASPHVGSSDRETVLKNIESCGVLDHVTLLQGEAVETLNRLSASGQLDGLGMVMIDDRHEASQITAECECVLPHLEDWGLICGHDVFSPAFMEMGRGYLRFGVDHRLQQVWLTQSEGCIVMQKRPKDIAI